MNVRINGSERRVVRRDLGDPSGRTLALFMAGDQLLKGAALKGGLTSV
jgi:aspartate-semialdehyde dehydrogenase